MVRGSPLAYVSCQSGQRTWFFSECYTRIWLSQPPLPAQAGYCVCGTWRTADSLWHWVQTSPVTGALEVLPLNDLIGVDSTDLIMKKGCHYYFTWSSFQVCKIQSFLSTSHHCMLLPMKFQGWKHYVYLSRGRCSWSKDTLKTDPTVTRSHWETEK
mgnify:CR=1 FL=1